MGASLPGRSSESELCGQDYSVKERRAYISWYADGIRVVDFSDPSKPQEIASFVDGVRGSDFWRVYLYEHPDGKTYILGSDRSTGLWIFESP